MDLVPKIFIDQTVGILFGTVDLRVKLSFEFSQSCLKGSKFDGQYKRGVTIEKFKCENSRIYHSFIFSIAYVLFK